MATVFGRTWWGLVLRGLLSILFGIAVFVWPEWSLLALITCRGVCTGGWRVRADHGLPGA
jgi:uncharacterized membrane protein HdeD (DUF308 family)